MAETSFWHKVDKTLRHHQRRAQVWLRDAAWPLFRMRDCRPLFIVGCSRAGTTLVYKTFSESVALGSLQRETHDFWAALHPPAAIGWKSHAVAAELATPEEADQIARHFYAETGHQRWVDKNNQGGLSIPYLLRLFPRAHFVYVKREPGDNVNSLIEGWMRPDEFATWSQQLPGEVALEQGRLRQWCFFLAEGWEAYRHASVEAVCAFQYQAMNQAILTARDAVDPRQWSEIHYEALVDDPVGGFRTLFESCDLPFDAAMAHHCATVLKRPYNAFSPIGVEKWRGSRFADKVERVLPQLAEVAAAMGYPR